VSGSETHIAFLQGRYEQCRRLLTSPRMNKPQREIIEEEAYAVKDALEALGVKSTAKARE
jgi:hypothetical protein